MVQHAGGQPLNRRSFMLGNFTAPFPANVEQEQKLRFSKRFAPETGALKLHAVDDYTQFLVQFAYQGIFRRFTRFDFPARKLPKAGHCLAVGSLLDKYSPGIINQGRRYDQKQVVRQSMAPILAIP